MTSKYIRTGDCNRCGECCKQVRARIMISKETGLCRFLHQELDGTFSCQITKSYFSNEVLERPMGVTDKQFQYWKRECKPFPDPNDHSHVPPRYVLPEKCGYKIVKVE